MTNKRINPYERLRRTGVEFARKVRFPAMKNMFFLGWSLRDVYERVAAAETLGYDVVLKAKPDGLYIEYVEKRPDAPWEFR